MAASLRYTHGWPAPMTLARRPSLVNATPTGCPVGSRPYWMAATPDLVRTGTTSKLTVPIFNDGRS